MVPANAFDMATGSSRRRTRKRKFLDEMDQMIPWTALVKLVEPHIHWSQADCHPFPIEKMLRIHCLQQWFGLNDPAMEEALHEIHSYQEFAGLDRGAEHLPEENIILRFRQELEAHELNIDVLRMVCDVLRGKGLMLRSGSTVDATLVTAPGLH
jgi:IS5 family transposase